MDSTSPPPVEADLRAGHFRARAKLFTEILKTAGYATVGSGAFEPFLKDSVYRPFNVALAGAGLAFLVLALYIAPYGERHD